MSLRIQLCRALSTAPRRAVETGAVGVPVGFDPLGAAVLDISFSTGESKLYRESRKILSDFSSTKRDFAQISGSQGEKGLACKGETSWSVRCHHNLS